MIIKGKLENSVLIDTWEEILNEYARIDNNHLITDTFQKNEQLSILAAQYIEVNAMLLYLSEVEYNEEYVNRLQELGYKVDLTKYTESISQNTQRAKHISTRINIIHNEIDSVKKEGQNKSSFDSIMAWLMTNNIMGLTDDITVKRYLEIKKQVNERNRKV